MRLNSFSWLGREFVALQGEGKPALAPAEGTRELLDRMGNALALQGLSLEHVVRNRFFGRDEESRAEGSAARREVLSGKARSAGTSLIASSQFDSDARVAMDLLALRPSDAQADKEVREFEPALGYPRYVLYDSVVFVSGLTSQEVSLEAQASDLLRRVGESLVLAGTGWENAELVTCFLHRSQNLRAFQVFMRQMVPGGGSPVMEYQFADGWGGTGTLLEVEVTATRRGGQGALGVFV